MKPSNKKFRKGDLVWLKSGGPKMTVKSSEPDSKYTCIWFQHGEIQHHTFERVTLTKSDPFEMFELNESYSDYL
jgi:uncharacterized protein YodC (DUF2158 family)